MSPLKYVVVVRVAGGAEMDVCEATDVVHATAVVRALLSCGEGSPTRVSVDCRRAIDAGPAPVVGPTY